MITYEDFAKLEIKIGTIVSAIKVEKSEKLLQLQIDLGDETRQVISGIAQFYDPTDLVGRQVPVLINLEPKEIMGLTSNGMILAADEEGTAVLLHPDKKISDGSKVR